MDQVTGLFDDLGGILDTLGDKAVSVWNRYMDFEQLKAERDYIQRNLTDNGGTVGGGGTTTTNTGGGWTNPNASNVNWTVVAVGALAFGAVFLISAKR